MEDSEIHHKSVQFSPPAHLKLLLSVSTFDFLNKTVSNSVAALGQILNSKIFFVPTRYLNSISILQLQNEKILQFPISLRLYYPPEHCGSCCLQPLLSKKIGLRSAG